MIVVKFLSLENNERIKNNHDINHTENIINCVVS